MKRSSVLRGLAGAGAASALGGVTSLPARAQGAPIVLGASLSLSGIYADGGKYSL